MSIERMLGYYLVERGSTNGKQLLRGKPFYFGDRTLLGMYDGSRYRFRCLYRQLGQYPNYQEKLVIAMLPTGDMLVDMGQLRQASTKAYYTIEQWVGSYSYDTSRVYEHNGQQMSVRKLSIREFNLTTKGTRGDSKAFSSFLERNLATEE